MSAINSNLPAKRLDGTLILHLPVPLSKNLPSRGIVMVEGTLNGQPFKDALEPDGRGSHWLKINDRLQEMAHIDTDSQVDLAFTVTNEWPEPTIPVDVHAALDTDQAANALWQQITPMARWDWIRWIRSTSNPATRAKRIDVAMSKLNKGSRRPCCFNRSECTDPTVSKSGKLLLA